LKHIKFLYKYSVKYKFKLFKALICLTFVSLSNLIYPWLFKLIVDSFNGTITGNLSTSIVTVILLGVILLSTILGYYTYTIMNELGSRLRNDLRNEYFRTIINKPLSFFSGEAVGNLSSRATEDIGKLQPLFTGLVAPVYQNVLFITGCLALMFMLNITATLIVLLIILIPLPIMLHFSKKIRLLSSESQMEHAIANAIMEETLFGIREVKAFLLEKFRAGKYAEKSSGALTKEMKLSGYQAKSTQSVYLILSVTLIVIFYLGTSKATSWSAGDTIAFFFYTYSLTMAFLSIGRAYSSYNGIMGSTSRILELLKEGDSEINNTFIPDEKKIMGMVEYRKVSFAYNKERLILNDISFSVNNGGWLLVTGPSGSGKSTIANLLLGFYNPSRGAILIDEKDLSDYNIKSIRKHIGYVPQEPLLFNGTIKENILLTNQNIAAERLIAVLKICMLDEFIKSFPDGLETNISERGITLSAGQRSRIAIARAIINEPSILILDEANSMLEDNLEKVLWKNLRVERENKTTIIFSHHTENIPDIYTHFSLV